MRSANPGGPEGGLVAIVAIVLAGLLLVGQALFVVPAGEVAVITTLGKVSGAPRQPGLNAKLPLVQQVCPSAPNSWVYRRVVQIDWTTHSWSNRRSGRYLWSSYLISLAPHW